jgi:hypothetical protein
MRTASATAGPRQPRGRTAHAGPAGLPIGGDHRPGACVRRPIAVLAHGQGVGRDCLEDRVSRSRRDGSQNDPDLAIVLIFVDRNVVSVHP